MKIIETGWGNNKETTVADYVENELDGNDYDHSGGAIEDVTRTAGNTTAALGRLVECLVKRGSLDLNEVYYIAKGFDGDDSLKKV